MTYIDTQRLHATEWKRSTSTLPNAAKAAAPYIGKDGLPTDRKIDVCLPADFAHLNLLPEVRDRALALFVELGIPWHAGVNGGPSNHLLSSQVQCANALTQMAEDPRRISAAFGQVLDVGCIEEIEPGRFVTFEYIGPTDFFGEANGGERVRGAHCTSVDAAFRHRTPDGKSELVLVEWKYTESYRLRTPDTTRDALRFARYGAAVADPAGPISCGLLPFDLLLDEPIYQLVRQQLLAHALETAGVADRVRVLLVLPPDNDAYQRSLHRKEQRAVGATVSELWKKLLRRPDRFDTMDPQVFCDPAITSAEYVARYGSRSLEE